MDPSAFDSLGDYVVEQRLGHGPGTALLVGRHAQLGVRHALRVVQLQDAAQRARFEREVQALATLDQHEGVVRVFHFEVLPSGLAYFAFDLIEGQSLEEALGPSQRLSIERALRLVEQIARALAHVHQAGIVHGDLGLSSVVLSGAHRRPVLTGFGFVPPSDDSRRLTASGTLVDGARLLAPEQLRSDVEVGAEADVFALGAVAFRLLTGSDPHTGATPAELAKAIQSERPPAPSSLRKKLSKGVDSLVQRCLAKAPSARPSALQVAEAVHELLRRGARRPARARRKARVLAAVTVALAFACGLLLDQSLERDARVEEARAHRDAALLNALAHDDLGARQEALAGLDDPEAQVLAQALDEQAELSRLQTVSAPAELQALAPQDPVAVAALASRERAANSAALATALRPLDLEERDRALARMLERVPDDPRAKAARAALRPWQRYRGRRSPPARYYHASVHDAARGTVLVFGGSDGARVRGDTWSFDGDSWRELAPRTMPPPRGTHGLTYDASRERIVLFGGQNAQGRALGDTWEWDGETWIERVAPGPPARMDPAMAYDGARNRVVLFGGYTRDGEESQLLDDTWLWDGERWEEVVEGERPPARFEHDLCYDPHRREVVLHGGRARDELTRTWTWDGAGWSEHGSGPALTGHRMVYQPGRKRILAVGGERAWEWTGDAWHLHEVLGGPRNLDEPSAAFDATRGQVVVFGGRKGKAVLDATLVLRPDAP